MRVSFASLSVICLLACNVLGAPLPGKPVAAPAKSVAKPAAKPAAGKTPATKAPGKTCGSKAKRAGSPVKDAWLTKGAFVGGGAKGHVYDLPSGFNGQPAVIKAIEAPWHTNAPSEVSNLISVGQFLAWGKTDDIPVEKGQPSHPKPIAAVYIIMKKMGVNLKTSKLAPAEAAKLEAEAKTRYKTNYNMANKDLATNGPNFVYHQAGGKWVAEIIDWDRAEVQSTKAAPAAESIDFYCVPGAFPKKRAVFDDLD